jgi:hypothetical protein
MAELIVKLKQHTPIIHFQHYQKGATLRASELKPKLDKFLIAKFKSQGIDYEKLLIGNGKHPALNYKVKVIPNKNIDHFLPLPLKLDPRSKRSSNLVNYLETKLGIDVKILAPSPFFGNSDKIRFNGDNVDINRTQVDSLILAIYSRDEIQLKFIAWDNNLLKEIEENICLFFLKNNFGMRQDKGFGSFTVSKINDKIIILDVNELRSTFVKKSINPFNDFSQLFTFILDEYQLLKSGKNHPVYQKSKLFEYFIEKHNIRWEKRFIKQRINSSKILHKNLYFERDPIDVENKTNNDYNDWNDHQKNTYGFIRALLGLAEYYEFLVDDYGNPDRNYKYVVSIKHKPKPNKEKIERFPSPLFFKIIDGVVYLGLTDIYKEIFNEEFEFKLKLKGDKDNRENNLGSLYVPKQFDLKDFINNSISSEWINV